MILTLVAAAVLAAAPAEPLSSLAWLEGEWAGEGAGTPGAAAGAFSMKRELGGHILVRRSFAEYPAANGRPAFRHDDLTVISAGNEAVYYDNEGHVIHYAITATEGKAVFLSAPAEGQPRFRLTYTSTGKDTLELSFDIAPPGQTEFKTYLTAKARRAKP